MKQQERRTCNSADVVSEWSHMQLLMNIYFVCVC